MEFLLSRYRNLTALLLVILAQLVLLAYQVKSNEDVRLIRVWSVTAVTPLARVLEFLREHTIGVAENYFVLVDVRNENRRLKDEVGKLKLENQFLKTELSTADRVQALRAFQQRTPSRTLPARIIGTGTGANSRLVFIDQGSSSGVMRGMAVVTPDGIVGKVLASYPTAAQVLLITDNSFAAGVISEKNRVHGTLKGVGQNKVIVDYVQNEETVEPNEMFYTSGDDRIFPKGLQVGRVTVVRPGRTFKEIFVVPSGFQHGLEEVLVVVEGVHGQIPDPQTTTAAPDVYILPSPERPKPPAEGTAAPGTTAPASPSAPAALMTDADRLRERYKRIGETQGIDYGDPGKIPNFNVNPNAARPTPNAGVPGATAAQPGGAVPRPGGTGTLGQAPPESAGPAARSASPTPGQPTGAVRQPVTGTSPAGSAGAPPPRPGSIAPATAGQPTGAVRQAPPATSGTDTGAGSTPRPRSTTSPTPGQPGGAVRQPVTATSPTGSAGAPPPRSGSTGPAGAGQPAGAVRQAPAATSPARTGEGTTPRPSPATPAEEQAPPRQGATGTATPSASGANRTPSPSGQAPSDRSATGIQQRPPQSVGAVPVTPRTVTPQTTAPKPVRRTESSPEPASQPR